MKMSRAVVDYCDRVFKSIDSATRLDAQANRQLANRNDGPVLTVLGISQKDR